MDRVEHDRPKGSTSTGELGGTKPKGVRQDRSLVGAERFPRRGDQELAPGAAPPDLDIATPGGEELSHEKTKTRETAAGAEGRERAGSEPRSGDDRGWAPEID